MCLPAFWSQNIENSITLLIAFHSYAFKERLWIVNSSYFKLSEIRIPLECNYIPLITKKTALSFEHIKNEATKKKSFELPYIKINKKPNGINFKIRKPSKRINFVVLRVVPLNWIRLWNAIYNLYCTLYNRQSSKISKPLSEELIKYLAFRFVKLQINIEYRVQIAEWGKWSLFNVFFRFSVRRVVFVS